jgi:CheY-like chemotaxis protein
VRPKDELCKLDRNKLRQTRSREGRYLLRTNLVEEDPAKLWSHYLGYETIAAADTKSALALVEQGEQLDAVLSDYKLPGMTGRSS